MRRRDTLRLAAGAAGLLGILSATGLHGSAAGADVTTGYLVSNTLNTSDPYVTTELCGSDLCMYTSSDVGSGNTAANPYPMNKTYLFTLASGLDPSVQSNWVNRGVVLNESQITTDKPGGFVPPGANHLWAPAVATGPNLDNLLYVPDVSDTSSSGVHTSSHISVSRAVLPNLLGPFTYVKQISIPGYASDPAVFPDFPTGTGEPRFLLWANGDGSNCGGLSMAQLDPSTMMDLVPGTTQQIQINGIGVLGNCGGTGRPYLEGPTLYNFSQTAPDLTGLPGPYTLVFAAKPTSTPTECTTEKGQPGSANEVIAYATSSTQTGPYTYRGIIMCGSSTDFTNQASIVEMTNRAGAKRMVIVYHDGPGAPPRRKIHADCVWYGNGTFAAVFRRPNAFNECMSNVGANYIALREQTTGKIVSSRDTWLIPSRFAVGPQEYIQIENQTDGTSALRMFNAAFSDSRFVSAENAGNDRLIANRTAIGPWEKFSLWNPNGDQLTLVAFINGNRVRYRPGAGEGLIADQAVRAPIVWFDILHL